MTAIDRSADIEVAQEDVGGSAAVCLTMAYLVRAITP
jgi:hypothetical protein